MYFEVFTYFEVTRIFNLKITPPKACCQAEKDINCRLALASRRHWGNFIHQIYKCSRLWLCNTTSCNHVLGVLLLIFYPCLAPENEAYPTSHITSSIFHQIYLSLNGCFIFLICLILKQGRCPYFYRSYEHFILEVVVNSEHSLHQR